MLSLPRQGWAGHRSCLSIFLWGKCPTHDKDRGPVGPRPSPSMRLPVGSPAGLGPRDVLGLHPLPALSRLVAEPLHCSLGHLCDPRFVFWRPAPTKSRPLSIRAALPSKTKPTFDYPQSIPQISAG